MAITMRHIANEAHVSVSTVSKVINGHDWDISDATRERVLRVVEEHGYIPNPVAQSLRTKNTKLIGLIVPEFEMPIYPPIISGVDAELTAHGFALACYGANNDVARERESVRLFSFKMFDGLIVYRMHGEDLNEAFDQVDIPAVLIDRVEGPVPVGVGQVFCNLQTSVYQSTIILAERGCKNIALVCNSHNKTGTRFGGYIAALKELGFPYDPGLVIEGPNTYEAGRSRAGELLDTKRVDGMVCGNDLVAEGALTSLKERGLKNPEDVILIANDVTYLSTEHSRAFDCVRQPARELGTAAAKMLLANILHKEPLFVQEIPYTRYPTQDSN